MSRVDARRVEEVFDGAVGLAPDAIDAYLDEACAGDAELRGEVAALLAADAGAGERAPERIAARAVLAEAPALAQGSDVRAAEPRTIGAFHVVRRLGEGGMGVVYEAYDDKLDRNVAVKLVRGVGGAEGRARLLAEARALAKVAHANVVSVHEVGLHGDEVFLVMELVEGETLRSWLRQRPRTWREVLAMYVGAGRGLEAAHAAGIVHRDFKPDNVLVGEDGRPRVVDFGLARAAAPASASNRPAAGGASRMTELTVAGTIVGTPAFMSPEHFRGEAIDPRSDQFSFAVALFRSLFDAAPFPGGDVSALRAAVLAGAPPVVPPTDVPPAVVEALLRALSVEPADRFPSMRELLAVLERELATSAELDPARSRNKRRLAAALLVVAGVVTSVPLDDGPRAWSTPKGLVVLGCVALGTLLVLGVAFRRMLLASAYNRRVAALYLALVLGFIAHRVFALRLGSRVEEILIGDAMIMAVLLAFAGLTLERWMALGTVLAVGYAALATAYPPWAAPGFAGLLCAAAAVPVLLWRAPRVRAPRRVTAGREKNDARGVGSGRDSADDG